MSDVKQALATRAKAGVATGKTLADYLNDNHVKKELERAAANHLDPDRLCRLALSLSRQPQLADCTPQSILSCVMQSAQLGLEPVLGRCYFVPFTNNKRGGVKEAQFILGYQGLIDLARRSGELKMIYAECVYQNDVFRYQLGLSPSLDHVPANGDRGPKVGVYAVARYKDDGFNFVYLTASDVAKTKTRSRAGDSGPWKSDEEAMWRKTAIKALRPVLPLNVWSRAYVETEAGEVKPVDFEDIEGEAIVVEETGEIVEAAE